MPPDAATNFSKPDLAFPYRYVNRARARRIYGTLPDRYARYYWDMDPLADAAAAALNKLGRRKGMQVLQRALDHGIDTVPDAPPALKALFADLATPPAWLDWPRAELGARTYRRLGPAAMLILSAWSLINGYAVGAAVKPLVLTGQLGAEKLAPRRLTETGRFVWAVVQPGGMRRFGEGFKIAVRVRLMHAWVRQMILAGDHWSATDWGAPINQCDMAGTIIEFSGLVLAGARELGFRFRQEEADALVHLWRYIGVVSGVDPWLLPDTESDGLAFGAMTHLIQPGPDADSVTLTQALRRVPYNMDQSAAERLLRPVMVRFHDGLSWALNGPEIAKALRIPNAGWRHALYPVRALVTPLELLRKATPGATDALAYAANQLVSQQMTRQLGRKPPTYLPVQRLRRRLTRGVAAPLPKTQTTAHVRATPAV